MVALRSPVARSVRRPPLALAFVTVLLVTTMAMMQASRAAHGAPSRALFYGDSLPYEAAPTIVGKLGSSWSTKIDAVPGRSLCTMRAALEADLAHEHPQRITIQSHGNPSGDCSSDDEQVVGSTAY